MSLVSGKGVAYACAYACAHQLLVLVPRAAGRDIIIHQRLRHSTSVQGSRRRGENIKKKGCTSQKSDRSSHSARIRAACNAVTNHLHVADRGRISRASIDDPYL